MFATPKVSGASNVKVYARIRPLLRVESEEGARNVIRASSSDKQVVIEDGSEKLFTYEGVFEENAGQDAVYLETVAPLVAMVKKGHNATVLAYGQTGSGKTHTMGTCPDVAKEDEGILQRALQALLTSDENDPPDGQEGKHAMSRILKISMIEIYKESIFDLLASRNEVKIKHEVGGGASALGLMEEHIETVEEGLTLLEKGTCLRSVGTTAMNINSSRSHALIFLTFKQGFREGCLKLVDLAGAEGVGRSQTSGQQFTEGVNINKGLLSLGKVLAALSKCSVYIPYRESLLTRVLKDSLGGGSYTAMIACVNPSSNNVHETINTLRYAEQARNIKMKVQALSTIKKSALKRKCEDVSATPGVWKKRILGTEKLDHNSTISTPGHKPPVRKLMPVLNMSLTTPLGRQYQIPSTVKKHGFDNPLLPLPSFGECPLEEDSLARLSPLSAIGEPKTSPAVDSPFMERVTKHLEETMVAHLEKFEDRFAEAIISKLTHKTKRKQRSFRKKKDVKGKSMSSTPTDDINSSGTEAESSVENILEATISRILFKKKNILEEVVSKFSGAQNRGIDDCSRTELHSGSSADRKPFEDVTNMWSTGETNSKKETKYMSQAKENVLRTPNEHKYQKSLQTELPITSTAVCESRNVRRSTRMATRISLHKAVFKESSTESKLENGVMTSANDTNHSCINDVTVVLAGNDSTIYEPSSRCHGGSDISNATLNISLQPVKTNSKLDQHFKRRSSRMEALKATQKNFVILQGQSPLSHMSKRQRSFKVRKNSSALCATSTSFSGYQRTEETSLNESASCVIPLMMVSPKRQKEHNESILNQLNTGTLRELQRLPTVGPKSAMVINNFRNLCGRFTTIKELEGVPGLSKTFYSRFLRANLMTEELP